MYPEEERRGTVLRLNRSLYGLKGTDKIWFELMKGKFLNARMREMFNAPCVFCDDHCVAVCYVNNLSVLTEDPKRIRNLKEFWLGT